MTDPTPPTSLRPSRVEQVHETALSVATVELSPPHPPRVDTPAYAAAHHFLVYTRQTPCEVCGVTVATLVDPAANPSGAAALETHHYPIERSLMDACDPVKVHRDYPSVYDGPTLAAFVDSPANLKVLCDQHHRSLTHGIHHLLPADYAVQRYLYTGYVVAVRGADAGAALLVDTGIMATHDATHGAALAPAQVGAPADLAHGQGEGTPIGAPAVVDREGGARPLPVPLPPPSPALIVPGRLGRAGRPRRRRPPYAPPAPPRATPAPAPPHPGPSTP